MAFLARLCATGAFHVGMRALPAAVLGSSRASTTATHVALVAHAESDDDEPVLVADARYVLSTPTPTRPSSRSRWPTTGSARPGPPDAGAAGAPRRAPRHAPAARRRAGRQRADAECCWLAELGCEVAPLAPTEAGILLATIEL